MTHELKCWPVYFQALADGRKNFEVRQNDRGFSSGDVLVLKEWDPSTASYTGRELSRLITYIAEGPPFLSEGTAVLALGHLQRI